MKFNVAAAAASAAFLVGGVSAEDQKVLKEESSSVAESATQAAPELPTFTVSICASWFAIAWPSSLAVGGNND
jgi:calnexin